MATYSYPSASYQFKIRRDVGKSAFSTVTYGWRLETVTLLADCIAYTTDYNTVENCQEGIRNTKRYASLQQGGEVFLGQDGKYYWHLKASNGRIICRSDKGYPSERAAGEALALFYQVAPYALVNAPQYG